MGTFDRLRGIPVVCADSDVAAVRDDLLEAGVALTAGAPTGDCIHLVAYRDAIGVVIDPDAPPIEWVGLPLNANWLLAAIRTGAELLHARRAGRESHTLLQICRAMASERDPAALERLIVRKARELTNADAGSLYVLEDVEGERALRFAVAQTGPHDEEKYTGGMLALSDQSIAGRVALEGAPIRIADAYGDLSSERVRFDSSFDQATGYRTKSVLCAPVKNHRDETVGVLQLINRKPAFDLVLSMDVLTEELVMPFDDHDEEIVTALAAQAGVALGAKREIAAS